MDVDAYVAAHRGSWRRLEDLLRRNRLTGAEADELVSLYTRTATQLSVVRSNSPDPALVEQLSRLVSRARSKVTGVHSPAYRDFGRFFTRTFPSAVYRTWPWWVGAAALFLLIAGGSGYWVAGNVDVQSALAPPEEIRQLVEQDFENYYREHPSQSFAAQVSSNNAWVAALTIALGVLILPVLYIIFTNALNVGMIGGLMAANDKLDIFFGLILPHGLLELTAIFVAAGAGLRLGWAWVDPGRRTRVAALGEEGRAMITIAMGLVVVLLISGLIEGFVTPSGLPTWARITIGAIAEVLFLVYVFVVGRRAYRQGATGDLERGEGLADFAPVSG